MFSERIVKKAPVLLMVCITVLSACSKGYRQVVIVNDTTATLHTLMEGNAPGETDVWEPGRVILFRTDSIPVFPRPLPIGNNKYFGGQAGHVYELDTNRKPKDIGTFDLKRSDNELIQRYAK